MQAGGLLNAISFCFNVSLISDLSKISISASVIKATLHVLQMFACKSLQCQQFSRSQMQTET